MTTTYCVYVHTVPNGKKYVGATRCKPVNRRWQNGYGYARNKPFFDDIERYGWTNIKHEIIADGLSVEEASRVEHEYVNMLNTTDARYGYNLAPGGRSGYHLTSEHKEKIGKANAGENNGRYGYRYTDEERKKLSENSVWRGKTHTAETRKKISERAKAYYKKHPRKPEDHPFYGKHHSDESRKKQSESAKRRGCCMSPETLERIAMLYRKEVSQYSADGTYIATYSCAKEAAKAVGLKGHNGICACANNNPRQKTAGGYVWRYTDANKPTL